MPFSFGTNRSISVFDFAIRIRGGSFSTVVSGDIPSIQLPATPRLPFSPPQQGVQISQTTHVQAPFSPEMVAGTQGVTYPAPRLPFKPPQVGLQISQTTHVQAPISVEMFQGSHPDSPRLPFVPAQQGLQISQTTPVQAAFSQEMVQGYHPDTPRITSGNQRGVFTYDLNVRGDIIAPMVVPDRPRLPFEAGQTGWQDSQTTHVQAPISVEMFAGSHPDSPRLPFVTKLGLQISQTTHVQSAFSPEMVQGYHPDTPRLTSGNQRGVFTYDLNVGGDVIASMVVPDRPRLPFVAKLGLQIAQTTHVQSPFSPEMVQGNQPTSPRFPFAAPQGIQISQTTHVQASFSQEMVQGYHPDQPRITLGKQVSISLFDVVVAAADVPSVQVPFEPRLSFSPPQVGVQISQTTPVQAPISVEMFAGSHPDTPRLTSGKQVSISLFDVFVPITDVPQIQVPFEPRLPFSPSQQGVQISQTTHVQAPIFPEMFQGSHPDSPRLPFVTKLGLQISQTTFDQAAFSQEMVQGYQPSSPRIFIARQPVVSLADLSSFIQEAYVQVPTSPRLFLGPRIPLPISQTTHVQAAFSPEMAQGYHPDLPVLPFTSKPGLQISQITHVQAPISVEMFAGYHPDTPRITSGKQISISLFDVFVPVADVPQVQYPSVPRLPFKPPQVGIQIAQTTHIQAPFSPEMAAGFHPDTPRLFLANQTGVTITQTAVVPFSSETVIGYHPDTPRLFLANQTGLAISQPTHVQTPFSPEMAAGAQGITYPSPRLHLGARIPLPISQTTHVQAPISIEMFQGYHPDTPRLPFVAKLGLQIAQTTFDQAPISIEMFSGYQPDKPRLPFKPPQVGVQISQTTHVQSAFSQEMVQGYHPDTRARIHLGAKIPLPISQTTHVQALFSQEMVAGTQGVAYPTPRLHLGVRIPQPLHEVVQDIVFIDLFTRFEYSRDRQLEFESRDLSLEFESRVRQLEFYSRGVEGGFVFIEDKTPTEILPWAINYRKTLSKVGVGQTVQNSSTIQIVDNDTDQDVTASMLVGLPIITDVKLQGFIQGGVLGKRYRVTFAAITQNGSRIEDVLMLSIIRG